MAHGEASETLVAELLAGHEADVPAWVSRTCGACGVAPPSLRADPGALLALAATLDVLRWQLQRLELERSVQFETGARRLLAHSAALNAALRSLRLAARAAASPIEELAAQIGAAEARAAQLQETLASKDVVRLRKLRERRARLTAFARRGSLEQAWRRSIAQLDAAMDVCDLDAAQHALEALDAMHSEHYSSDGGRAARLAHLRDQLVALIMRTQ